MRDKAISFLLAAAIILKIPLRLRSNLALLFRFIDCRHQSRFFLLLLLLPLDVVVVVLITFYVTMIFLLLLHALGDAFFAMQSRKILRAVDFMTLF
jgi:hypothetical protein